MIKDRSKSFPMADQPGLRCVMLSAWAAECTKDGGISQSPDTKQRRRMFRDAVKELEQAGLVKRDAENGERVYPHTPSQRDHPPSSRSQDKEKAPRGPSNPSNDIEDRLAHLSAKDVLPNSPAEVCRRVSKNDALRKSTT
jgi:hypothetical protein